MSAFPSSQLFDLALNYLAGLKTKIHHKYIVNNIGHSEARIVIQILEQDGLISKDEKDYYLIKSEGRRVIDSGGYQNFLEK